MINLISIITSDIENIKQENNIYTLQGEKWINSVNHFERVFRRLKIKLIVRVDIYTLINSKTEQRISKVIFRKLAYKICRKKDCYLNKGILKEMVERVKNIEI